MSTFTVIDNGTQSAQAESVDAEERDYLEDFTLPEDSDLGQDLVNNILNSLVLATIYDPPLKYIPDDALRSLITKEAVERELGKVEEHSPGSARNYPKETRSRLATWIVEHAYKVFAITTQCELDPQCLLLAMLLFRRHGFTDACLPIPENLESPPPPWSDRFRKQIWSPLKVESFHERQWRFMATIFTEQQYDYDLPAKTIFPLITLGGGSTDGAFSHVYQVRIHEAHKQLPRFQDFALKELRKQNVPQDADQRQINQAWENEAAALAAIKKLNHNHIVECIAAIRRGNSRYFMFPWADGKNLRDFWNNAPRRPLDAHMMQQIVEQLRGIADALDKLHNFPGGRFCEIEDEASSHANGTNPQIILNNEVDDYRDAGTAESFRHGDLKPENILRFLNESSELGVLKLADMGLAKRHVVATQLRSQGTNTRYSTRRYEAPETVTQENARSRLYDIWSMGCITLEFIIWVLYGNTELKNLYKQIEGRTQQICQYYKLVAASKEEPGGPQVHPVVVRWMNCIEEKDPECTSAPTSAIKDLLRIVREKLLIVPLPPNRLSGIERGRPLVAPHMGQTVTLYRATAAEFRDALDEIMSQVNQPGYMFTGNDRTNVKPPSHRSNLLSTISAKRGTGAGSSITEYELPTSTLSADGAIERPVITDYALPPLQGWEFEVDNAFADSLLDKVGAEAISPKVCKLPDLCRQCGSYNFWKPGFSIEEKASDLHGRAPTCQFCKILYDIYHQAKTSKGERARFERDQSSLVMTGQRFPVLSIVRTSEVNTQLQIQLGFPDLPETRSETFYTLIKLWLEDCDANHEGCKVPSRPLPTRLIDVGDMETKILRLIETQSEKPVNEQYIALSHPWGDKVLHPPYRTLSDNVETFRRAIPEDELPQNFRDAVECTRQLGVRYLWIDSLCIIQGDDGDFSKESPRMEDVFSGAFCVLAASRANGQHDGFLGPRRPREYITFKHANEKPFYVCETIDNFSKDVIDGSMNKRGWVLQERILARRTIYFTEQQTYFECGNGVRCETLTKKRNKMAEYLADPNFPEKVMDGNRASKITTFQSLYRQYSRLDFSRYTDRPFAIAGLEKRLQRALKVQGDYGIFDDGDRFDGGLFHRSLLWQRGEQANDAPFLIPITFPEGVQVPSWSWMAYKGGIDYTDPKWDTAEWEMEEIKPPWTHSGGNLKDKDGRIGIEARVRDFDVSGWRHDEKKLMYDTDRTATLDGPRTQCVVVARTKGSKAYVDKQHYVLLVVATKEVAEDGKQMYKRVGAGYMLGKFITLDGPGVAAKLI